MTPANATDVQQFSPQHSQHLSNPNRVLNLRTPSSFISKVPQSQTKSNLPFIPSNDNFPLPSNIEIVKTPHLQTANENQQKLGQYHYSLENISNHSNLAEATNVPGDYHLGTNLRNSNNQKMYIPKDNKTSYELKHSKNPNSIINEEYIHCDKAQEASKNIVIESGACAQKSNNESEKNLEPLNDIRYNALLAEQMLFEALLPPSAANASNIVGSSLDEKELMYIREKLSNKYSNKNDYKNPAVLRELENIR
jgi:hypothetical protein